MEMQDEIRIEAPRTRVYEALNDPEILKASIPGCEELTKTSDTELEAKVVLKIGPVKAKFGGSVTLDKSQAPGHFSLSGEGNGGVILPELHAGRDGLVGTALVLAAMASTGRPLSALADALPDYRMEKRRLDLAARVDSARLVELATRHFDGAALDTRDGVKASYGEGWIHVRASNTEAILRLIGESEDGAWLKRRLDDAEVFFSGALAGGD